MPMSYLIHVFNEVECLLNIRISAFLVSLIFHFLSHFLPLQIHHTQLEVLHVLPAHLTALHQTSLPISFGQLSP